MNGRPFVLLAVLFFSYSDSVIASDGWRAIGQALGGAGRLSDEEKARVRQQVYEEQLAYEMALNARLERQRFEQEQAVMQAAKERLASLWIELGLGHDEATAIANTFKLTDDQDVFIAQATKDGTKATISKVTAAYHNNQFLLANQLLFAAWYVHSKSETAKQGGNEGQPPQSPTDRRREGFEWARLHAVRDARNCEGETGDHIAGCLDWVDQQSGRRR